MFYVVESHAVLDGHVRLIVWMLIDSKVDILCKKKSRESKNIQNSYKY